MFIERIDSGHVAWAEDQGSGVMSSPINLSSFYTPLSCSPGHLRSSSPSSYSQSGHIWNSASCLKETNDLLNFVNDGTAMGTMKPQTYMGVRVKNPVKDLILQKYRNQSSWSSNDQNQAKGFLHVSQDTAQSDNTPDPELYLDISDKIPGITESAPISMATAQMGATFPWATPLCNTVPPHVDTPTEPGVQPVYPTTDPGSLSVGNDFYIPPLTPQPDPQPDPPPPLPAPQSLSFEASSGVSFFQWQIEQAEAKVTRLAPEQLAAQDSDGDTFLHIAVAQGRRALSYAFARSMAGLGVLDVKDYNGQSALQLSVAANQHLIVQDLMSLGAQISTADRWGRSPLHVCAEKGHDLSMQAIHKALGTTGQKVNTEAVNYDGLTALHTAVLSHNAVLKDLEGEAEQQSAQRRALQQRRKELAECIRTLLLMGASYRTKDHKSGRTSLHMAAEEANVEVLRLFLDQPDSLAVVNAKAYSGNTALHVVSALTSRPAQVDAVRLLMRRGADPSIRNLEKEQPSQLVPEGPVGDMVWSILKGKGLKPRPSQ